MRNELRRGGIGLIYALTLVGSAAWVGAIFLAPYLKSRGSISSGLIYAVFAPVCHQMPERSFYLFGHPLAVCGRCLGIYLGFLLGALFYPWVRGFSRVRLPGFRIFLMMSAPILLDTVANFLRLWSSSNLLRLVTGLLWGLLLPFYFITGLAELAIQRRRNKRGVRGEGSRE